MNTRRPLIITCAVLAALLLSAGVQAESKRVRIYSLSQDYWDVLPGESLSEIAARLLPKQPNAQQSLMQSIVTLNPAAFVNGDPNRLRANYRLTLPKQRADTPDKPTGSNVEEFSWGSIKRAR